MPCGTLLRIEDQEPLTLALSRRERELTGPLSLGRGLGGRRSDEGQALNHTPNIKAKKNRLSSTAQAGFCVLSDYAC